MKESYTTYEDLSQLLLDHGIMTSAAELHGIATGVISAMIPLNNTKIKRLIMQELSLENNESDILDMLQTLVKEIQHTLEKRNIFPPILPTVDDLTICCRALSDWCQGYLTGLALGGLKENGLSPNANEILYDISNLTGTILIDEGSSEEDDKAYFELVEYIKIAIPSIYLELRIRNPSKWH